MNFIVVAIIASAAFAIIAAVILGLEQRDKDRRRAQGLPPRKYHDITDSDVYTMYTFKH